MNILNNNFQIKAKFEKIFDNFNLSNFYLQLTTFFKQLITKMQDLVGTNYDLGLHHLKQGNISDAIMRFKLILYFQKNHLYARYNLSRSYIFNSENDKAIKHLKICLEQKFDFMEAQYLLSTIDTSYPKPSMIPLSIIEDYFNDIAEDYSQEYIIKKNYLGPQSLYSFLAEKVDINKLSNIEVLELGCGIGNSGNYFREKLQIANLTGVDITNSMLIIAKKLNIGDKPVYDFLIKNDIESYLNIANKKFDLIIAVYSLHYISDLAATLSKCKNLLSGSKIIAFSVQKSKNDEEFAFNSSMSNFWYSQNYIEQAIKKVGFNEFYISKNNINDDDDAWQIILIA
jgi:predicted TPR repeat methyltransferase